MTMAGEGGVGAAGTATSESEKVGPVHLLMSSVVCLSGLLSAVFDRVRRGSARASGRPARSRG